jgi:hypothetical protein
LAGAVAVLAVGAAQVPSSGSAWADNDNTGGGQPNDKLPVYLDRIVHPTAQDSCAPGTTWVGAGIPATTFQRKRNFDAGVELAIKAQIRQGPDIRSTYVDEDGLVHIEVPTGTQQVPPTPSRAAWNFTFSYDVALDPNNPPLSQWDGQLWIDLDPSEKTKYLKLTLTQGGAIQPNPCLERDFNGYRWRSGNTVVIPDDEGTQHVTQNSQNYAFYTSLIDTDPSQQGVQPYTFGPGEFDVVMILKGKGGFSQDDDDDDDDGSDKKSTTLHVVFDVVAAPTQTP